MAATKIVVVTGANSGIGYEAVKALLLSSKSYHIYLGSRSTDKGNEALKRLHQEASESKSTAEVLTLDLDSDESISQAYDVMKSKHDHIDILVNNAGATYDLAYLNDKASLRECFNKAYNTNVAGTNVLTHVFMPLLLKSTDPRLIFVTGLSSINSAAQKYFPTPPLPAGWPKKLDFDTIGYRCSKVALNMLMLDWNHKLKADGVKVWAVGPGMLATNLGGEYVPEEIRKSPALGHPSLGGEILRDVVEGQRDADTGKIVVKNGGINDW